MLCSYLYIRVCAYVRAPTCARVGNSSFVLCECACLHACVVHACACVHGNVWRWHVLCVCSVCRSVVICMFYQVLCNVGVWMWLARGTMCVSAHYVVLCCVCGVYAYMYVLCVCVAACMCLMGI